MYRQVFIPNEQNLLIPIPQSWYGREVEVIAFPTEKTAMITDTKPRHNWAKAAQQMHIAGDDMLSIPAVSNNENIDWWTWEE
jgi:hypothetical protein